jgi:hypothetical protein
MDTFKSISREAIPEALEKAERYRLLNEPYQAESICLDVLAVDPDNQPALVMLLLALTDQFRRGPAECVRQANSVAGRLASEYERLYYRGLICERRGLAAALREHPGSGSAAYAFLREAMDYFEQAEPLRPAGNDDAILRWNCCVRLCERYHLAPELELAAEPILGD